MIPSRLRGVASTQAKKFFQQKRLFFPTSEKLVLACCLWAVCSYATFTLVGYGFFYVGCVSVVVLFVRLGMDGRCGRFFGFMQKENEKIFTSTAMQSGLAINQ